MPNPEYTDNARKKKINGTVIVALIVTAEGTVRDPKIIKSLDQGLDKQAIAAVSTWKFEPATQDGKPVAVHLKTEVDFRLY
jgi:TonB family protein